MDSEPKLLTNGWSTKLASEKQFSVVLGNVGPRYFWNGVDGKGVMSRDHV